MWLARDRSEMSRQEFYQDQSRAATNIMLLPTQPYWPALCSSDISPEIFTFRYFSSDWFMDWQVRCMAAKAMLLLPGQMCLK